ncbi:hypothetical protein [Egicoccus sp. AB-alg6-2]|uniref:hypothetical protein n=1 Tax=Egicoccus sp. AB-alg6-2 TaxID=3242692 RepID=UPI00359DF5C2
MTGSGADLARVDTRSRRLLLLAASVVVVTVALVLVFGVQRPPALERVADVPSPTPPTEVAWTAWKDTGTCVHVARPDGGVDEPWCGTGSVEIDGFAEDAVVVRRWDGGRRLVRVDLVTGAATETADDEDHDPLPAGERDAIEVERLDGQLVVRNGASGRELWRTRAPESYAIQASVRSPDGDWLLLVDTARRLLVVPADGSVAPRVWAEDVPAWRAPVWRGSRAQG